MESTKTPQSVLTFVSVATHPALTVMAQLITTALNAVVPLPLTLTLASAQVPSTNQEVAAIPATQGAMDVQALETPTAMIASSEEILQMFVVHQEKTTFLELGVLQLALLTSIETQEVAAKIVIRVVVDVQRGQTQIAIPVTLVLISKKIV